MWILILAMYANQYSDSKFSTINTQEFSTETTCLLAADKFKQKFKQLIDVNARAIYVKK
ncbi:MULTISPECIES: hypothetical protein [unclassified Arsenophonus]|uniref:hypothetical protein n=1 Tax=unclassified Arsenophonus TaxID=2627083 RepID=UPI00285DFCAE|nr:hypothetical protein [Arsenophonus sp.]MDR5609286.1 hypothetical protein [Arsenophonus sp.]MDR5613018.1 hypothetical protein [Arsenophonus sp.]